MKQQKRLVNFDFNGFLKDCEERKCDPNEEAEIYAELLNAGYNLDEVPIVCLCYQILMGLGYIVKRGNRWVAQYQDPYKPILMEDLEKVKCIKVYESEEEWNDRHEQKELPKLHRRRSRRFPTLR